MTVIKPEMINTKITRKDVLPLSFLKKTAYTGSKRKLRYKMAKTEVPVEDAAPAEEGAEPETKTVLCVYSWFGPFAFDSTPQEEMRIAEFEFKDSGIDAAIEYLNKVLEEGES